MWEPFSDRPVLVRPSGKEIPLVVFGHIPYLRTRAGSRRNCAAASSGTLGSDSEDEKGVCAPGGAGASGSAPPRNRQKRKSEGPRAPRTLLPPRTLWRMKGWQTLLIPLQGRAHRRNCLLTTSWTTLLCCALAPIARLPRAFERVLTVTDTAPRRSNFPSSGSLLQRTTWWRSQQHRRA